MGQTLPKQDLPEDWAVQVHEAFVDVQKWALIVESLVLPWHWRNGWAAYARQQTDQKLFGVDVHFAMVDRPIATIRS